jgi:hypothetical protein
VDRPVRFAGGRLTLRVGDWPLLGPPDAPHVLAYLFDYTCPSCRDVRRLLGEAVARGGGAVAVLLVPVPQDPACNPDVGPARAPAAAAGARHACAYARLALAAWAAAPAAHEAFERWLFDAPELPAPGEAARRAAELTAGYPATDGTSAEDDPRIARAVAAHRAAGTGKIPTLLLPRATVTGAVPSLDELENVLRRELGVAAFRGRGAVPARPARAAHGALPGTGAPSRPYPFASSARRPE